MSVSLPPLPDGELSLDLSVDLDDIEDGEIDPTITAFTNPKPIIPGELISPRPPKKRKVNPTNVKRFKKTAIKVEEDDDFWDDSELIAAWDRAMDRVNRQKNGEVLSPSEDEMEEIDDSENHMETDLTAPDPNCTNYQSYAVTSAHWGGAHAATISPASVDPHATQLSDEDLVLRMSQHSYLSGFYAGILHARRSGIKTPASSQ